MAKDLIFVAADTIMETEITFTGGSADA